jgi:hypothetical protein
VRNDQMVGFCSFYIDGECSVWFAPESSSF